MKRITIAFVLVMALVGMPVAQTAYGLWENGLYDDPAWYNDTIADNDWFYDTYDPTFYDYGVNDWYDYGYTGIYNDQWSDNDWYYDEYELGHWDPWGYDDPGEAGIADV